MWGHNRLKWWAILGGVFVALLTVSYFFMGGRKTPTPVTTADGEKKVQLVIPLAEDRIESDPIYTLEVADDYGTQRIGLGGRDSLAEDKGMLFLYNIPTERCFWARDMRFPIDIIWVDSNKEVLHMEEYIKPETYPTSYCARGQYVIELNAGEVEKTGLSVGQHVQF